ncbi:MAG TPA: glutathionylspermidine synthase family protein [Thermoanaerobaculia bacterium]|jgi:glutathionylspermidine synthase|nr:glutathionylspermidine synthase family protein [Thermoanaerobaculia bacterium]
MVELTLPWVETDPVDPAEHARLRRRAIFECCKWDPQVEDVSTVAPFPLLLRREAWDEIAHLSERLAAEAAEAEEEMARRPELHCELGLPRPVRHALREIADDGSPPGIARVLRFDFHWTTEGWRISEANTDVPGGFNEASGFARLMAPYFPGFEPSGDPAGCLADAVGPSGTVALVHATAYTDDRQVMVFLARELEARGQRVVLAAPDHLTWRNGEAWIGDDRLDALIRFFPAEWLPNLPRSSGWKHFFRGGRTPVSNPASALLPQSKRFPLVWDRLATSLPTWRRLLPETRDPREVPWRTDGGWVLKPALGRVGDGIGLAGVTPEKEWKQIRRELLFGGRWWAAQQRFEAVPMKVDGESFYPCVGVYTIDGRAAGGYGRVARRPIVNHLAQDVAVLVEPRQEEAYGRVAAL